MPNPSKGPRLWKRPAAGDRGAVWWIKDGSKRVSTGVAAKPTETAPPAEAERALSDYIGVKHVPDRKEKDVDVIPIADVLAIYLEDKAKDYEHNAVYQRRFEARILRLNDFFGNTMLGDMSTKLCRDYVTKRGSDGGARRDLEDLRAAIGHHAAENLHHAIINVTLPPKGQARERWLTRDEVASLLWTCWRHREVQTHGLKRGKPLSEVVTSKYPLRHIARFILIALYTGTRSGAVAAASPYRAEGRSYVDLEAGVFYRLPIGQRATNKRQPAVALPDRLLAHMRRWHRLGVIKEHFVEWHGQSVASVKNGFASAVELADLDLANGNITPHTLRHTAATWVMQRGTNLWEASGFLGMSPETLKNVYGHHHPEFMKEAANNITKKPTRTVTRTVRERSTN